MKNLTIGSQLNVYGEKVTINKVETFDTTTLLFWHHKGSPLSGVKILTPSHEKNIILNT